MVKRVIQLSVPLALCSPNSFWPVIIERLTDELSALGHWLVNVIADDSSLT
ncbi:hypothetical protein ROD_10481 [Citrobacter rodentium ICC168]|uniref:Uncharacterized protein n=1 Tax=Citrobacter rodentium (strain ICC168) TaxID=637910 RepID=D2TT13_CITRI|nr:hypothetical protein ROD_10481 [Citrobacter rodentium ICC168]